MKNPKNAGKYPVRESGDRDEKKLAIFIEDMRKYYAAGPEQLSKSWVDMLSALPGWTFKKRSENSSNVYSSLQSWLADHAGKYPSPKSDDEAEASLGNWLKKQRASMSKNRMDPYECARLKRLPGWRL